MREGEKGSKGEEVEQLREVETGLVTTPVANYNATINYHKSEKRHQQEHVGPGQKEKHPQVLEGHGIHQQEVQHSSEFREWSLNGGKPLLLLLLQFSFPGFTALLCNDVPGTEGSPDDVGLTEHEAAKPKQGRSPMVAVKTHQISKKSEEYRPSFCIVKKVEKIEGRKYCQG